MIQRKPTKHWQSTCCSRQGPKGGVPGALEPWNFCCGARSPIISLTGALIVFWLWSPEPKEILRGARSPAFLSLIICSQVALILGYCPFCVCLCVLTGIKKQNLKAGVNLNRSEIWSIIERELLGLKWNVNTTIQLTINKDHPNWEPQVGRGLFGIRLLILYYKFQCSKSIKSSIFRNFLNLSYSLRKNISFPKCPKITQKFTQNRQTVVMGISREI